MRPFSRAHRLAAGLALAALARLAASCTERAGERGEPLADDCAGADASQEGAAAEGLEAGLFLRAFDPGIRVSRFAQLEIAAGRFRQRTSVQLLGLYLAGDGAELAARSGRELVVVTSLPAGRGPTLHRLVRPYALGAKDVPLGDFPVASLALVGRRAFIGGRGLLGMVDFAAADPKLEVLQRSPRPSANGGRTLIASEGDQLFAIEGGGPQFFADAFLLRGNAIPHLEQRLALPPVEGRYSTAALLGAELLLMAEHDGAQGRGRSLRRVALASLAQARPRGAPAVAQEFAEAGEGDPAQDSPRPAWHGLAAVGGMLVVCAGERGALVYPRAFSQKTRPLFVDVDGLCLDVVASRGKVYALVKSSQGLKVASLADGPQGLGVEETFAVTGLWAGLVH